MLPLGIAILDKDEGEKEPKNRDNFQIEVKYSNKALKDILQQEEEIVSFESSIIVNPNPTEINIEMIQNEAAIVRKENKNVSDLL